jgi:iron(III) transport system ATP-binding protein
MISVAGLTKTFQSKSEAVRAVNDVSFEVAAGEMVTLLGPSGCGKTTTLRLVAGLEKPDKGRIAVSGRTVVDPAAGLFVPPHRRNLGMVFQSYAVWPHMTVIENVAYALEGRGIPRAEMKRLAMDALTTVQLAHLADRPAPRLSGGQQQRVAIARAIVGKPQALLFDEPLSNLDAKLRGEMRAELSRLQRQIGLSSIYVTHDQAEALAISDWIVVMKDGRVVERGRPTQIYRYPQHIFTAQFIGNTNLLAGSVESIEPATGQLAVGTVCGRLIGIDPQKTLRPGDKVRMSIRPEDLLLDGPAAGGNPAMNGTVNQLPARVEFTLFTGATVEAEVRCGETKIFCLFGRDADVTPGAPVTLRFAPETCVVLPEEA